MALDPTGQLIHHGINQLLNDHTLLLDSKVIETGFL